VKRLREEETHAALVDAARHRGRVEAHVHAECLEHVGASRCRGDSAVAMLGDRHARASDYERGGRGDVEGMETVAAGSTGVDVAGSCRAHGRGVFAHGAREADDLVDRLTLHPHPHHKRADLRRRRLAVHDRAHHQVRFALGKRAATAHPRDRAADAGHLGKPCRGASCATGCRQRGGSTGDAAGKRHLAGYVEEVREELGALGREYALGMELHAKDGLLAMP
jgi:hypothetical protein